MHIPSDIRPRPDISESLSPRLGRRRFAFWVGFGLFSLGERLRAESLDTLAAAVMRAGDDDAPPPAEESSHAAEKREDQPDPTTDDSRPAEHWTFEENERWYWFERETFADDQWEPTGRTRPVHKHTGRRAPDAEGYVADDEVAVSVRRTPPGNDDGDVGGRQPTDDLSADAPREVPEPHSPGASSDPPPPAADAGGEPLTPGQPSAERRARHGRPPSRWLRSLRGDELRTWLATVDVPEAGVSGMSFWVHLTRDHRFHPKSVSGLTTEEQAKLHAAAHHGY